MKNKLSNNTFAVDYHSNIASMDIVHWCNRFFCFFFVLNAGQSPQSLIYTVYYTHSGGGGQGMFLMSDVRFKVWTPNFPKCISQRISFLQKFISSLHFPTLNLFYLELVCVCGQCPVWTCCLTCALFANHVRIFFCPPQTIPSLLTLIENSFLPSIYSVEHTIYRQY